MTNKEYITATLGRFGIEPDLMAVILLNQGLSPDKEVDIHGIKMALYREIPSSFPGLSSISEGGLSYSFNADGLKLWYQALCRELGVADLLGASKIEDATDLW